MLGQKALMLGPWWLSIQEIQLGRFVPLISPLSLKDISACLDFLFPVHILLFIIDVIIWGVYFLHSCFKLVNTLYTCIV